MKRILFPIAFCLISLSTFAQNVQFRINYSDIYKFDSEKDSINHFKGIQFINTRIFQGKMSRDMKVEHGSSFMNQRKTYELNNDTLWVEVQCPDYSKPDFYFLQNPKEAISIQCSNGARDNFYRFTENYAPKTNNKTKIRKTYLGEECLIYRSQNKKEDLTIWVAKNISIPHSNKWYKYISHKGKLILKHTWTNKEKGFTRSIIATTFEKNVPNTLAKKIQKDLDDDRKLMYAPCKENQLVENSPLKIGTTAPNLYFKYVDNLQKTSLYSFKGENKYTLLEFWGSWCIPCMASTSKLKQFHTEYKNKVNLISFNWGDRKYEKVKELIHKKQMDWTQALATEKIIEVYNPQKKFPAIILLDENMKVLFIGLASKELDEVKKLIQ